MKFLTERKVIIILLIIIALAAFFRFWSLDSIPPGLYPDEAINGNDALISLKECSYKLFYPENNGREGLFIWLLSLSFGLFGPSIAALRIVPALFGTLTVLGLYFLVKTLFPEKRGKLIALLSSFFLAVSFWHVNFSRIGFRAILVPFLLVFGFYFLNKALKDKRWIFPALSGIFLGLGFYTYISYRFVIFLFLLNIIVGLFYYNKKILLKTAALCALVTFIVASPLGFYFLKNPEDFFGRASGVSVLSQENPLYKTGESFAVHTGMFNVYGDHNWRHNFSESPQLLWPVGILFLIGFILSVAYLIKRDRTKVIASSLLLGWFFIFLMPGVLTYEGIPHALRVIGVIPAVYIFSGLGGVWLFSKIKKFFKKEKLYFLLIAVLLFSIAFSQADKYFNIWSRKEEVKGAFSYNYVSMGRYLNTLEKDTYVIVNKGGVPVPYPDGIPMPSQTLQFIERTKENQVGAVYLKEDQLERIDKEKKSSIVLMGHNEDLIIKLYKKFPNGFLEEKEGFWVYNLD